MPRDKQISIFDQKNINFLKLFFFLQFLVIKTLDTDPN